MFIFKAFQADTSDVLGVRLLALNSSDSLLFSLGGEFRGAVFRRSSIFSMPWIGDSNMRHRMSAAKNVRQTWDSVSPSCEDKRGNKPSNSPARPLKLPNLSRSCISAFECSLPNRVQWNRWSDKHSTLVDSTARELVTKETSSTLHSHSWRKRAPSSRWRCSSQVDEDCCKVHSRGSSSDTLGGNRTSPSTLNTRRSAM